MVHWPKDAHRRCDQIWRNFVTFGKNISLWQFIWRLLLQKTRYAIGHLLIVEIAKYLSKYYISHLVTLLIALFNVLTRNRYQQNCSNWSNLSPSGPSRNENKMDGKEWLASSGAKNASFWWINRRSSTTTTAAQQQQQCSITDTLIEQKCSLNAESLMHCAFSLGWAQCDQIGQFLRGLCVKFSFKSSSDISDNFLENFVNRQSLNKTPVAVNWATLGNNWATFNYNTWSHWLGLKASTCHICGGQSKSRLICDLFIDIS